MFIYKKLNQRDASFSIIHGSRKKRGQVPFSILPQSDQHIGSKKPKVGIRLTSESIRCRTTGSMKQR